MYTPSRCDPTLERRTFPTACTSAFCGVFGNVEACLACRHRPALEAWRSWVEETDAVPISSGSLTFESRKGPLVVRPIP